jgi:hypothetical protein
MSCHGASGSAGAAIAHQVLGSNRVAKAIAYSLNCGAERALRCVAVGRLKDIDLRARLADVLARLPDHPAKPS